jgi:hypothetical protein
MFPIAKLLPIAAGLALSLPTQGRAELRTVRLQRVLPARLGESSRTRISRIFKDVAVLYGFSGVAPRGPVAGAVLDRYFRSSGAAEAGTSRASGRLLAHFAEHAMVSARGSTDADQEAACRSDVCHFLDDRLSLRDHRMKSPDGRDVIDVLLRRLATL